MAIDKRLHLTVKEMYPLPLHSNRLSIPLAITRGFSTCCALKNQGHAVKGFSTTLDGDLQVSERIQKFETVRRSPLLTMNKPFFSLILACLLGSTAATMAGIEPGDKAPAFSLLGTKGRQVNLSNFDGMYIVLEWLNHSCPQVQKVYESGTMQDTQKKQTSEGVVWLSILSSTPGSSGYTTVQEALEAAEKCGSDATAILLDPTGTVSKAYGATLTPEIFIINPKGRVIYHGALELTTTTGLNDTKETTNYVNLAIAEAKAGTPLSHVRTEPDGCEINIAQ